MSLTVVGGTEHLTPEDRRVLAWYREQVALGPDAPVEGCWVTPRFTVTGGMLRARMVCTVHGEGGDAIVPVGSDVEALLDLAAALGPCP